MICLVTGANAGIGKAAALQLAQAGHAVVLGCRDRSRGEATAGAIRAASPAARVSVLEIDLSLQSSIRAAASRLDAVDVVIHNAAHFDVRQTSRQQTAEGFETTWATNHLGPALLTELLLPKLLTSSSPRVVGVTSKGLMVYPRLAVDLEDTQLETRSFSIPRAYYQSKLAHLAWLLDLAERLGATPVRVHGVRVTNVKIDISRYPGLRWYMRALYALKSRFSISPEEMARTYVWLATHETPGQSSGGYWDRIDLPATPSRWATDATNRRRLRDLTAEQLGMSTPIR